MARVSFSSLTGFGFLVFLIGCSIIPDDSFDEFPNAKIETIEVKRDDGKILSGEVAYTGQALNPSKIAITWNNGFRLFQIPIVDTVSNITQTVYEVQNERITKISNINNSGIEVRVETFTYDTKGYLATHTRSEKRATGMVTFENVFFYTNIGNQIAFDSVYQTRCVPLCIDGFFNGELSIIPYDKRIPYSSNKNSSSNNNNDRNRSFFETDFYAGPDNNNSANFYSAPGASAKLNFSEVYESVNYYREGFNFWGYKEGANNISLDLQKVEYLLNLYYFIGNYLLPQKNTYDENGDGSELYSPGPYGFSSNYTPTFWILSRLSIPIEQYDFSVASSQKYIAGDRTFSISFNLSYY